MGRPTLRTPLCDMFEIEYPIVLAGMGAFAMPELVAAVSNAGGLGVLGATSMTPAELRDAIRRTRQLTAKPFGVDVILPLTAYGRTTDGARGQPQAVPKPSRTMLAAIKRMKVKHGIGEPAPEPRRPETLTPENLMGMVAVTVEERVPVFVSGLGNPGELVPCFHERGVRVMALVGNVRSARRVVEAGVDVVIAQGHEAGGHTGRIGTLALVPQVADAVAPVPVLAAGGIGDGRGLAAALALGAIGVWCGTVFAAAEESAAERWYKEKCVALTEEDTIVSRAMTGKTCRIQKNRLLEAWDVEVGTTLPMPIQAQLCRPLREAVEQQRMLDYMGAPAGQIMGMIREIRPARRIVEDMVTQAAAIIERGLGARLQSV